MKAEERRADVADEETTGADDAAVAEPAAPSLGEALLAELAGPTFGLPFFCSVLRGRLERHCAGAGPEVPQVLLHLAGGSVLDLCHIVELAPRWIAAATFRDARSCEQMDLEFVPYELIVRVTLSSRPAEEHRLGFDAERSAAALQAALRAPECHDATT